MAQESSTNFDRAPGSRALAKEARRDSIEVNALLTSRLEAAINEGYKLIESSLVAAAPSPQNPGNVLRIVHRDAP